MEENNLRFELPKENGAIIKVIGVGGGGSNAVDYMFQQGIKGVDFIVCNTDAQALDKSEVPIKIQLGATLTRGQGAGSHPEVGKNAAVENLDDVKALLGEKTTMVFITAGMGGGTGTGAAPIIAQAAKDMGILTVGIVTVPFFFEGKKRSNQAEGGLEEMRNSVDTLLVIKNDKLRELYGNLSLKKAFSHADEVLCTAAKGIAEVITLTGEINVDMNDVNTVMRNSGVAIMGSGLANGEGRALRAVTEALESPLLNDNDIEGANFVLLNITYGSDEVLMDEIMEITDHIQEQAGQSAEVIWGYGLDKSLEDSLCVTLIATGFKSNEVDSGLPRTLPKKEIYMLGQDELTEVKGPIEKPTQQALETEIKKESVDVTPETEAEPFLMTPEEPKAELTPQENLENAWNETKDVEEEQEIEEEESKVQDNLLNESETEKTPEEGNLLFNFDMETIEEEKPENDLKFDIKETENQDESKSEEDKKYFSLEDDTLEEEITQGIQNLTKENETPAEDSSNSLVFTNKNVEIDEDRPSKDVLVAKNKEREITIRELTSKLKTPSGLSELEKEPAYKRRQVSFDTVKHSSESSISKLSVDGSKDGKDGGLSDKNPFIHDNAD